MDGLGELGETLINLTQTNKKGKNILYIPLQQSRQAMDPVV